MRTVFRKKIDQKRRIFVCEISEFHCKLFRISYLEANAVQSSTRTEIQRNEKFSSRRFIHESAITFFFLSKKINELAFGDDLVFSHDTFFIMKFIGDNSVFSYFLAQRNY